MAFYHLILNTQLGKQSTLKKNPSTKSLNQSIHLFSILAIDQRRINKRNRGVMAEVFCDFYFCIGDRYGGVYLAIMSVHKSNLSRL